MIAGSTDLEHASERVGDGTVTRADQTRIQTQSSPLTWQRDSERFYEDDGLQGTRIVRGFEVGCGG
ncbi:hypothetical protein PAXRUDRAFT_830889 [Paxillus rubicundulus Ve08.2h10]|uniref:Uncharacterized protein n=1 Tax=Paxillus rubicundulus Ve08.2h10 TaxID=930991 RepID=A0A0D0DJT1_9AGAM|nr:hypothetical protein PAXRUDRAFT_830889 [Paxillus rubicundulus Ve08.2h10]